MFSQRYARQLVLKDFGPAAQQRLMSARVLIVGAGGLGAPAAMYLAAAGVGTITLVDRDVVDETNLHRQLLYGTSDVGRQKLEAAADRLHDINPEITVVTRDARLTAQNASEFVGEQSVVIDATDNFPARYAINDACLALGVPFVYGSVARFEGQVSVFGAPGGPCYRCLFPEMPAPGTVPTCADEGVLGIVPGIVGLHQAMESVKWITGIGTTLAGRLMLLDLLDNETRIITVPRRADCRACGEDARARSPSGSQAPPITPMSVSQMSPQTLAERIERGDRPIILDVREQWEYDRAHLSGSILIPLVELQSKVGSLDRNAEYVVLCHHGMRSDLAASWLADRGFSRMSNLTGGIDAWSLQVDPTMPRY